jgi:hypothetical protein
MKRAVIAVTFVVIGGVTAAADSPLPSPPFPPNAHVKVVPGDPNPIDRLQGACDAAKILADDLKVDKAGEKAMSDLQVLHELVCLKAN